MSSYRQLRQYRNGLSLTEYWFTAPPSLSTDVGPYELGDVVWKENPVAGGVLGWICTTAGQTGATAVFSPFGYSSPATSYGAAANTTSFTATAAQISGGTGMVILNLTAAAGASNLTLPLVTSLLAAMPDAFVGMTWMVRITNTTAAGANTWTVVTNTGWGTLGGTQTIAQNTYRDFQVTITSISSATATWNSVFEGAYPL